MNNNKIMNDTEWRVFISDKSKIPYYYNIVTEKSQWEKPTSIKDYDTPLNWQKVMSKSYNQY